MSPHPESLSQTTPPGVTLRPRHDELWRAWGQTGRSLQENTSGAKITGFEIRQDGDDRQFGIGVGGGSSLPGASQMTESSPSIASSSPNHLNASPARSSPPSQMPSPLRRGKSAPPSVYTATQRADPTRETLLAATPNRSTDGLSSQGYDNSRRPLRLGAILKPLRNGVDVIVDDSFWRCFEDRETVPWNWNFFLFPIWMVGTLLLTLSSSQSGSVFYSSGFCSACSAFLWFRYGMPWGSAVALVGMQIK